MVSGVGSKRQAEANKADSNKPVSTNIDENKKAVSYRQTHKQIARIQLNKRKCQANK